MKPPISFGADAVRDKQAKNLHAVQVAKPQDVISMAVRGQYGQGVAGEERLPAYRTEPMVSPASNTETYAPLRLQNRNLPRAGGAVLFPPRKALPGRGPEIPI